MENTLFKESTRLSCTSILNEKCSATGKTISCGTGDCDPGCCGNDGFNRNKSDGLGGIVVSLDLRG